MDAERQVEAQGRTMVDTSSITELIEFARAMTEGDFHKELNIKTFGELGLLGEYIEKIRRNLQHLDDPLRDTSTTIPLATNQLSNITESTERATHNILGLTEKIMSNQEILSSQIERLEMLNGEIDCNGGEMNDIIYAMKMANMANQNDLTEILTSLSFQDLTGQKIQEIISLMREIQEKMLEMRETFGIKMEDGDTSEGSDLDKEELTSQLQDTSQTVDLNQDLVDEILADFNG